MRPRRIAAYEAHGTGAAADTAVEVSVKYQRREWPYGVVYVDGKALTPNRARRLVAALEDAIARAEEHLDHTRGRVG